MRPLLLLYTLMLATLALLQQQCASAQQLSAAAILPPILAAGKTATLTIKSETQADLSKITVQINETNYKPDNNGQITFPVLNEGNISIDILNEEGSLVKRYSYYPVARGVLSTDPALGKFFLRLYESKENSKHRGPYIFYAPTTVEAGKNIIILGNNFSGRLNSAKLSLGNRETAIIACSPYALIGQVLPGAPIGPVQDLSLKIDGEASNSVETDVCRLSFELPDPLPLEETLALPVKILGSNLPSLVDIKTEGLTLTSVNGKESNHEVYLTTGGEHNIAIVALRTPPAGTPSLFQAQLLANLPAAVFSAVDNNNLWQATAKLCKAQIIRLKRRLIYIEQKLAETRIKRDEIVDATEVERLTVAIKALSLRRDQLQEMLAARHELFLSLQYTQEDYQTALDEAAEGAYFTVDDNIQPVKLPDIDLSLLERLSSKVQAKKNKQATSPLPAIPVPKIKLWVPLETEPGEAAQAPQKTEEIIPAGATSAPAQPTNFQNTGNQKNTGKTEPAAHHIARPVSGNKSTAQRHTQGKAKPNKEAPRRNSSHKPVHKKAIKGKKHGSRHKN